MNISTFESFREKKNLVLYESFKKKFMNNSRKFDSLSKHNSYRKIQRKNFIEVTSNDDNITNILNKISESNFDRLQLKIMMKLNVHNAHSFCTQILSYSRKSSVNSIYLAKLMVEIFKGINDSNVTKMIELSTDEYVDEFLHVFDVKPSLCESNEDYHEFLERNLDSIRLKNTNMFVLSMLDQKDTQLKFKHDVSSIFTILCQKINILTSEENIDDAMIFKLFEAILLFLSTNTLKHDSEEMIAFKNKISMSEIEKKLKNKTRFKLMDIFDYR